MVGLSVWAMVWGHPHPVRAAADAAAPIAPTATRPMAAPEPGAAKQDLRGASAPIGNPLWAIPLTSLTATGERPLFAPSRRPPAPAVAAAPAPPPAKPPPAKPAEPDRPALRLVGTIAGKTGSLGIFVDQATNKIVRLWTAESHAGWTLQAIQGRQAVLAKDQRVVTLVLPDPSTAAQSAGAAPVLASGGPGADWVDGDGQRIARPQTPPRLPSAPTWVDGDGQSISPPSNK